MQKHVKHIILHNCYYPNPVNLIQWIRFIPKLINPLYLVNISPDHPLDTITKFSTTEINIIHNLTRQINKIIMGITSTGINTTDPRTNTNYPMVSHTQGFQL